MRDIILQNAKFLKLKLSSKSALLIAQCSRGTPRIAKKIVRRIRDYVQVHNKNSADERVVVSALHFLGLDEQGLTNVDNLLLKKMIENFNGGPVGLETLASMIGEDPDTIETVYEPYLLRLGYLEKTARGRQIPHKKLPQLTQRFLGQKTLIR